MKNIVLIILFSVSLSSFSVAQTVNYSESNSIIANPERGLQKYSITANNYATNSNASNLSVATLTNWKTGGEKATVVYRMFLLKAFLNSDISTTYLNNIQKDFDNIREAGLKVIVRFAYSNNVTNGAQQPSKSQILTHISQLEGVLSANEDIIFSTQAGFIGTWGEWYYTNSSEFGHEDSISNTQWSNRKEVLDALLNAVPSSIPIQVRYTDIKKTLYGSTTLNSATAYNTSPKARIGFFNDAFLNNYADQGTYATASECQNPVGSTDFNYLANETQYLPMTGETNGINPCNNEYRTTGENAVNEMRLTNFTTLNRDYYIPFWDGVIETGHYDEILKNLGYRFVLNSSKATVNNNELALTLNLTNVGYARPFKKRRVFLVLKDTNTDEITTKIIDTDIRTWEDTVTLSQSFTIQNEGDYQLYVWMPDSSENLQSNSDYSIQFANKDTWNPETGYNNLLQTISIGNALALEDIEMENNFAVYPNPTSGTLNIKAENTEIKTIKIHNTLGQLVLEASNNTIDVSTLARGVYFVTLNNNKALTKRILKQ